MVYIKKNSAAKYADLYIEYSNEEKSPNGLIIMIIIA